MSRRKQDRTLAPACHLRTGTGRRRRRRIREREEMLRETGMAEVNGARIYYEAAGEGDPLVLVHAGIADSRMWEDQLMAFADRDGGGTVLLPRGPARSTRLSERRAGAPRELFDGGRNRARLRA